MSADYTIIVQLGHDIIVEGNTAYQIARKLETLTGIDRLSATALKDLDAEYVTFEDSEEFPTVAIALLNILDRLESNADFVAFIDNELQNIDGFTTFVGKVVEFESRCTIHEQFKHFLYTLTNTDTSNAQTSYRRDPSFLLSEEGVYDVKLQVLSQTDGVLFEENKEGHIIVTEGNAYDVTFTVQDEVGGTIQGAVIEIIEIGRNLVTNISGRAVTQLTDGDYNFTVSYFGFDEYSGSFTVDGADLDVDVIMTESLNTVTFNVTSGGSALQGAQVTLDGYGSLTTDELGVAEFDDVADGTYSYSILKSGFETESGTVVVDGNETVNVSMNAIFSITFTVQDKVDGGQPLQATISIDGQTIVTDESTGQATISDLYAGIYEYTVEKPDFTTVTGTVEIVDANIDELVEMDIDGRIADVILSPTNIKPGDTATLSYDFFPDGYEGETMISWYLGGTLMKQESKSTVGYDQYTIPEEYGGGELQVVITAYDVLSNTNANMTQTITRTVTLDNPVYYGYLDNYSDPIDVAGANAEILDVPPSGLIVIPWALTFGSLGTQKYMWILVPKDVGFPEYDYFAEYDDPDVNVPITNAWDVSDYSLESTDDYTLYKIQQLGPDPVTGSYYAAMSVTNHIFKNL